VPSSALIASSGGVDDRHQIRARPVGRATLGDVADRRDRHHAVARNCSNRPPWSTGACPCWWMAAIAAALTAAAAAAARRRSEAGSETGSSLAASPVQARCRETARIPAQPAISILDPGRQIVQGDLIRPRIPHHFEHAACWSSAPSPERRIRRLADHPGRFRSAERGRRHALPVSACAASSGASGRAK
jgi:hypothetical protein